jgi:hypothetical protein
MSTIITLTKTGKVLKTKVSDSISEIWCKMNGEYGENSVYNFQANRDYMLLTDIKGNAIIFHKRYLWRIEE